MTGAVGSSVRRKDGIGKANGTARYADDLEFPGMLHARTIRSTVAKGRLAGWKLESDPAGLTIVDCRDIPGRNIVALITDDQPCLVEREIRHVAEPVLLLAHESRAALCAARVALAEEPGEPVYDPERSPAAFKTILIEKGDVAAGGASVSIDCTLPPRANATRSQMRSTSSSWCELMMSVVPRPRTSPSSLRNSRTPAGSIPEIGSSRKR